MLMPLVCHRQAGRRGRSLAHRQTFSQKLNGVASLTIGAMAFLNLPLLLALQGRLQLQMTRVYLEHAAASTLIQAGTSAASATRRLAHRLASVSSHLINLIWAFSSSIITAQAAQEASRLATQESVAVQQSASMATSKEQGTSLARKSWMT